MKATDSIISPKYTMRLVLCLGATMTWMSATASYGAVTYTGVNLAGADFTGNKLPGVYGSDYIYPTTAEIDYFLGKGMNTIRLPFLWERLQRTQNGAFDAAELSRINTVVNYATRKGGHVILDVHNYARYYNTNVIGTVRLPIASFTNFWNRLAALYRTNNQVIFGLMNEPHDMSTEVWRNAANAAIASIRDTGAANLILVSGNGWSIAHDWNASWYGTPNATVMRSIVDPGDNFAFEVHDYFDDENTNRDCQSNVGIQRLLAMTSWCRTYGFRAFYGEFGVSTNATCITAMTNMFSYLNDNSDVWLGWTYWAAGPWWGNYRFSLEPDNGTDRVQMDAIEPFLPIPQPQLTFRWLTPPTDAVFTFPRLPGNIFQPQKSLTLDPPSWANFGVAITGGTTTATVQMQSQSDAQGFFRVHVQRVP